MEEFIIFFFLNVPMYIILWAFYCHCNALGAHLNIVLVQKYKLYNNNNKSM